MQAIFQAISDNNVDYLREHFDDVSRICEKPLLISPWSLALIQKKFEVVKLFLEKGENPNKKSHLGNHDLRFLVLHHKSVAFNDWIDLFVSFGSDIHVRDDQGGTLLELANLIGNTFAVQKLTELGASK